MPNNILNRLSSNTAKLMSALLCHLDSEIIIVFWTVRLLLCILSPLHLLFATSCRHSEKKETDLGKLLLQLNFWLQLCKSLPTASQNFLNVRNASDHLTLSLSTLTPHCTLHDKRSVTKLKFGPISKWVMRLEKQVRNGLKSHSVFLV